MYEVQSPLIIFHLFLLQESAHVQTLGKQLLLTYLERIKKIFVPNHLTCFFLLPGEKCQVKASRPTAMKNWIFRKNLSLDEDKQKSGIEQRDSFAWIAKSQCMNIVQTTLFLRESYYLRMLCVQTEIEILTALWSTRWGSYQIKPM
jgi:hypothetical protein